MLTQLNIRPTTQGVELSDRDSIVVAMIKRNSNENFKPWTVHMDGAHNNGWHTLEAAEFYALALYADAQGSEAS